MKILYANTNNIQEMKNIIHLIYTSFTEYNKQESTERLIQTINKLYGPGYNYIHTLKYFKKSNIFLVAKENNTIIGMVRWIPDKLSNLYIQKGQQGKGVGTLLLQRFETEAKKLWSSVIKLKSSKYALPFYLKNWYTFIIQEERRLIKYL